MARRRKSTDTTPFDTLRLEGSLFVPELLERAARGEAAAQKEADYAVPKGLKLHDEYGRAYRIATALWQDFALQLPRTDLDPGAATHGFAIDFLRQCLGYIDLTPLTAPVTLGDRGFPITAQALGGRIPVVIAPHRLGLDEPDPCFAVHGAGVRKKSAHQLAQEFLNADRNSLWALVTNGKTLRLLRDAETLTRPNFLEFDLETILREGEDRYAEFSALWRILHASRAGIATALPADCIWEKWKTEGHAQGLRVRDGLRDGVTQALLILGTGFLAHRDNDALRLRLHDGTLTKEDYFQQLLHLVYRCLFLFCAEERDLLHSPTPADPAVAPAHAAARKAYAEGYSLRRLRNRSLRQSAHDTHADLWQSIRIVFRALASGQPRLALPTLGGLFAETQCPDLDNATLSNRDLLAAIRQLRWSSVSGSLTAIDYRNMGPEELGSIYESLLELVPQLDLPARSFGFVGITDTGSTSGNARKTTGSYYTPDSLVQELIKSALDPVIAARLASQPDRPIDALLSITVCDPSCGSGHFLLAAARRLAEKLAELRAPDGAVRPDDYRHALREVASRCLYGVDINPMAVELCRVALWLETVDPGKPLGFLNHHIRTGNSLLGTAPELIAAGLPDDTFTAIEGDDKAACTELKKRNKKEREGFGPLFKQEEDALRERLRQAATQIEAMDDSQPEALQRKEAAFTTNETAPEYRHAKLLADLWCAAFVIKKVYPQPSGTDSAPSSKVDLPSPVEGHLLHTQDELFGQPTPAPVPKPANKKQSRTASREQGNPTGITAQHLRDFVLGKPLPPELQTEVEALANQYRFFHWHIAFPQVFDQGGFDCLLGNPPWDRVKFNEQDWFAERRPEIANATTTAARKKLINDLSAIAPALRQEFECARREFQGLNSFIRASATFPNGSAGELNLATLFAERASLIIGPSGQAGLVLPTTIVTDKSAQPLCRSWLDEGRLIAVFDFENRLGLFPDVDSRYKFAIITLRGAPTVNTKVRAAFYLADPSELADPAKLLSIDRFDILRVNPNTLSFPVSRTAGDAQLLLHIHCRAEPLLRDTDSASGGAWGYSVFFIFEMNKDSGRFATAPSLEFVPLLEAKLMHQFDHRAATFLGQSAQDISSGNARPMGKDELADASLTALPRYWVPYLDVQTSFKRGGLTRRWAVVAREITNATNERTVISCIIPQVGMGHTCWALSLAKADAAHAGIFMASLNSIVLDYAARQKVSGTHLSNFIIKQLPVLPPSSYTQTCPWGTVPSHHMASTFRDWMLPRVLELTYTAWDLEPFAADCGWNGPPFRWNEERRFLLRCELDAAFFHLYLGPEHETTAPDGTVQPGWRQQPEALTCAFPTPRDAVSYIMDTFPIVKRKDEAKHGFYRTKETILEIYDALAEAQQPGAAPFVSSLNPRPADILATHDPRLPASLRPSFSSADYFEYIVPLIARLQSEGVEVDRLLLALEILSESEPRRAALKGQTGVWSQWAAGFPRNHAFSDAAAALLVLLQDDTLTRWQGRISAPPGVQFVENEWLNVDAFIALRLALAAPAAAAQQRRAEIVQRFPALAPALIAA